MLHGRFVPVMLFLGAAASSAYAQAITSVSLTPSHPSPQVIGTPITWTAVPTGGVAPFTYKWWQFDGTAWTMLRDWSTSNALTWTPSQARPDWRVGVWVRNAGNTVEGVCDAFHYCASVEFPVVSTCTYTLSPASVNVGAEGGDGIVTVSTMAGCVWAPNSSGSWLTPADTAQRYGSGTMSWSATTNINTGGSREAGILIGNRYFDVFQCEQVVVPRTITLPAGSGTTAVEVVSSGSCPWTASAPLGSFATIASSASGTGYGPITIAYAANSTIHPRTTVITVAGQPVTLTQAGAPCTYTLTPPALNVGAAGGSGSVAIAAPAGCTWTPNSNASWLFPVNTSAQSGSGTMTWWAEPNMHSGGSRQGGILIGDRYFNVFQCEQVVTPTTVSLPAGSGTTTVNVVSSGSCPWTATAPSGGFAAIVVGAAGTGQGSVTVAYTSNPTIQPRTMVITVAGQPVTLTQAAAPCTYTFEPAWVRVGREGGTGTFQVSASPSACRWTPNSGAEWLDVADTSVRQGAGTVTWAAAPSAAGDDRSAVIVVGNETSAAAFHVTQLWGSELTCSYSVHPTTLRLSSDGQSSTVSVSAHAGCSWTTSYTVPFVQLTSGGSGIGRGAVSLAVTNNTGLEPRVGTIQVAGQPMTIIQAGSTGITCEYHVSPGALDFTADGGSAVLGISPNYPACPWTVGVDKNWIRVTGSTAGTGTGATA